MVIVARQADDGKTLRGRGRGYKSVITTLGLASENQSKVRLLSALEGLNPGETADTSPFRAAYRSPNAAE